MKRSNKKFMMLILIFALAIAMTGCGSGQQAPTELVEGQGTTEPGSEQATTESSGQQTPAELVTFTVGYSAAFDTLNP